MGRMDVLAPAMDQSLALNRSKLLRLAESIKTRKRAPTSVPSPRAVQCDPSLTNIEHLVFGPTYRHKASPPPPSSADSLPSTGGGGDAVQRSHTTTTCRVAGRAEMKAGRSSVVGAAPTNYHSLDRNRSNVTLVHVNFPSPSTPVAVDASAAVAATKERRQRTPLTRSQQKPPVQLQSPPKTNNSSVVSVTVSGGRKDEAAKGRAAVAKQGACGTTVVVCSTNSNTGARCGRRPSNPPPPPKNVATSSNNSTSSSRRPSSSKDSSSDERPKRSDTEEGSSCSSLSPGNVTSDSGSSLYLSSVLDSSAGDDPSPPPPPPPKQQPPSRVPTSTHTNAAAIATINTTVTKAPRNPPASLRRSLSSNATALNRTGSRGSLSNSRGSFVPVKLAVAPSIPPPAPPKASRDEASECQVTCVKALPPPTSTASSSSTSVPRSPERVYKALYTWYEPRRRLSFPSSSSQINASVVTNGNHAAAAATSTNSCSTAPTSNGPSAASAAANSSSNATPTLTKIPDATDLPLTPAPTIRSSIKRPPSGRTLTLPKSFTSPTSSFYVDSPIPTQLQNVVPRIDDSVSDSRPREKTKPASEQESEQPFREASNYSCEQDTSENTSNRDSGSPSLSRGPSCLSKAVRRVKASSSPPALAASATDLSASDSDLRRPWSQVYSERDAENIRKQGPTAPLSCIDLASVPTPSKSIPVLSGRCSSLRAGGVSRPQGTPVESVLLKFRKSFSMRFQKNHLRSHSPDPEGASPTPSPLDSPLGGSTTSVAPENVFRFGPIVWRSSKERKSKSKLEISAPTMVSAQPSSPPSSATCSPVPVRPKASSLRLERPKRPLSEMGTGFSSSVALSSPGRSSLRDERRRDVRHSLSDLGGADIREALKNHEHKKTSPCAFKMPPKKVLNRRGVPRQKSRLRRSVSQPMEMDKLTTLCSLSHIQGLSDQEDTGNDSSNSSSDDEAGFQAIKGCFHPCLSQPKYVTYAEALWDHVTMDPEELPFKAGEQVAVLECTHSWWFGSLGAKVGWFPSSFVRPRVNQEDTVEDHVARMNDGLSSPSNRKLSVSLLSNDQVRINVIKEIVATERDFVQHLKDVIEGYLKQVRKRPDMFSDDRIATIFGNMEQLHAFQSAFLEKLEACIDWHNPELSQLGACFVEHKEGFQVYSEYCNNHPQAVNELQELFAIPKYSHFFEACRLLQEMIDISLDGFLLTPVQKICKYPLQLAELLKYTREDHPDYRHVAEALEAMREVAHYINERKRRMECLEKLAAWQLSVEYWEGPDLLDDSSELIHSGEVTKMTSSWSRDVTLFLFDHQLVVCKKDLLKRQTFCYKNRISMDGSQVVDLPDGRDTQSGLVVKSAWRVFCGTRAKWYTFCAKSNEEKGQWMKAFHDERRRVSEDLEQGFVVSEKAKSTAMRIVKSQLKRPKGKGVKEFPPRRSARLPTPHHPVLHAKTASLPHGVLLATTKKKNSGWFSFGSSKKHKR